MVCQSCGDGENTPIAALNPNQIVESCKDQIARTKVDSDSDGIPDFDEIYGWKVKVDNELLTVYTNPLSKDTDGDGTNDLDEQGTTKIFGRVETSPLAIAHHPARRDFILRIYAGLSNGKGFLNGQPTSLHKTGWNIFDSIILKTNDVLRIKDLGSDQWISNAQFSSASGFGRALTCPDTTTMCLNANENSLIGKTAKSTDVAGLASYPFEIGTKFDLNSHVFEKKINFDQNGRILMLRSNDNDSAGLSDNEGFITISLRIISESDYPQRLPTAAEENKILAQLCNHS